MSIFKKALEHYGVERQLQKCCEELAEAIVAIHHWKDKKVTQEYVASEIADVLIMCQQIEIILEPGLVTKKYKEKLNRLLERISHD